MDEITIDHGLPVINHTSVPLGVGFVLRWGEGTDDNPTDLTGRRAVMVLHPGASSEKYLPMTVTPNWYMLDVDEAGLRWVTPYVLLVADSVDAPLRPLVRGELIPGLALKEGMT